MQIMPKLSKEIWETNYKAPGENSYEDTKRRVAKAIASVEQNQQYWTKQFEDLLNYFMPGGRIISNAGRNDVSATLLNCFVTPKVKDVPWDSMKGIMKLTSNVTLTLASEGGVGFNISFIRPEGELIKGTMVNTPGPLAFMELIDKASDVTTRGTTECLHDKETKKKIRKGAMMCVMSCWHPDIMKFIKAKRADGKYTKFNLSVGITEDFMNAVINDTTWDLKFPDTSFEKYDSEWNGNIYEWENKKYPIKIYKTINARDLWNEIMLSTYNYAEPGVLFLDIINKNNPLYYCENINSTNPCGEQTLPFGGACCLGSMMLHKFVKFDNNRNPYFDFESFGKYTEIAIRFLDNVLDVSKYPLEAYKKEAHKKRRVGLGFMGLGTVCTMLGIEYGNNKKFNEFFEKLMYIKTYHEYKASALLGKEKGSFPVFDKDKYFNSHYWKQLPLSHIHKKEIESIGYLRNGVLSTVAPTGNTSLLAGIVSGGIEPIFLTEYVRWVTVTPDEIRKLKKQGYDIPDVKNEGLRETDIFKKSKMGNLDILVGTIDNIDYQIDESRGLVKAELVEDYSVRWLKENNLYDKYKNKIKTTSDLTVDDHLNVLKIAAKYISAAISKTVNVPSDYSFDDFKDVYLEAWQYNIKGITTYREGTMTAVLQKKESTNEQLTELEKLYFDANGNVITEGVITPEIAYGYRKKIKVNGSKYYIFIIFADKGKYKKPIEIWVHTNKHISCDIKDSTVSKMENLAIKSGIKKKFIEKMINDYKGQSHATKIARAIGLLLRHNVPINEIVEAIEEEEYFIGTLPWVIVKELKQFIPDKTISTAKCPKCNSELVYIEGCKQCQQCGWSKCG